MSCLITTKAIQGLYDKYVEKSGLDMPIDVFKAYIGGWQSVNHKEIDTMPTVDELFNYTMLSMVSTVSLEEVTEQNAGINAVSTLFESLDKLKSDEEREVYILKNFNKNIKEESGVSPEIAHNTKVVQYIMNAYNNYRNAQKSNKLTEENGGNKVQDFTLVSGATMGADREWARVASEYGFGKGQIVEHTVGTYKQTAQQDRQWANDEYEKVSKSLGRVQLGSHTTGGMLVRRDMLQARDADAVFAIDNIVRKDQKQVNHRGNTYENGLYNQRDTVEGDAAYAVEEARLIGKPIYVFDLKTNRWYQYNNKSGVFVETDTPTLTKKFAGIGTTGNRGEISQEAKQAIRNVFEKTFGNNVQTSVQGPKVQTVQGNWSRIEAENDSKTLYIFTDNTDRDSGMGEIDPNSPYAQKYGQDGRVLHYPGRTSAQVRGLPNAMPVSTQRYYKSGDDYRLNRWSDSDFDEFKKVIDQEFLDILAEWRTGKYDRIMLPNGGLVGNEAGISGMNINSQERGKCARYLQRMTERLIEVVNRERSEKDLFSEVDPFNTDRGVIPIQARRAVDQKFDPITRRNRENLISNIFSRKLDALEENYKKMMEERAQKYGEALDNAVKAGKNRTIINELRVRAADARTSVRNASRFNAIKEKTPVAVFREIFNDFNGFLQKGKQEQIEEVKNELIKEYSKEYEITDEILKGIEEEAIELTQARAEEFEKMVGTPEDGVWGVLCEGAARRLFFTEGLILDPGEDIIRESNVQEDDPEGETEIFDSNDPVNNEETTKEGWMVKVRQVSNRETLSQAVRKTISRIIKLDSEGFMETDKLGYPVYFDSSYVHAVLIDALRNMDTIDEMDELLANLAKRKPWVQSIIDVIGDKDDQKNSLHSKFFQDFRKDYQAYWIQKITKTAGGIQKIQTVDLSRPEGIGFLTDEWEDNVRNGEVLSKYSVYDSEGGVGDKQKDNAKAALRILSELNKRLDSAVENITNPEEKAQQRNNAAINKRNFNDIVTLLQSIGINPNVDTLREALEDYQANNGQYVNLDSPSIKLIRSLSTILNGVANGKVKDEKRSDGTIKRGNVYNEYKSAYNTIARMIADVTEDAVEQCIREMGNSYYAHTMPNYLGKLMRNLKDTLNKPEKMRRFIQDEYKQYEWFYKDNQWLNDWVMELAGLEGMSEEEIAALTPNERKMIDDRAKEARKNFDHKVLLNSGKVEYQNLSDIEYTIANLAEYVAVPDRKDGRNYAWYHIPIMADTQSAEYIKARRFTGEGTGGYKDQILDRMFNTVMQEYNRIQLIKARDRVRQEAAKNGKKSGVAPIAHYDIIRDKKGNITWKGGSEFKFYPALNDLTVTLDGQSVGFLEGMDILISRGKGSIDELKDYIKSGLRQIMDEGFKDAMLSYIDMGLFEEVRTEGQKGASPYKYLGFMVKTSFSQQNENTVKALERAKLLLAGNDNMISLIDDIIPNLKTRTPFAENEIEDALKVVRDALAQMKDEDPNSITDREFNELNKNLVKVKDYAREKMEEYYWNSTFATSQIIQLCTTDLAYYKNLEDFQKRFKEIHAPGLRLNTHSKYGREFEKVAILQDSEIVSEIRHEVENTMLQALERKQINEIDAATAMAAYGSTYWDGIDLSTEEAKEAYLKTLDKKKREQYKKMIGKYVKVGNTFIKTSKVNVTDGQAFRSLSSLRAVLDMSGDWTDEMEAAYGRLEQIRKGSKEFDVSDFNIFFQTLKPYVYTQLSKNSGMVDSKGQRVEIRDDEGNIIQGTETLAPTIKVPQQHKNSEALLLAVYGAMSATLNKASKLAGINEWMEQNEIDVVQFESAVKVGKQGLINLEGVSTKEDVIKTLNECSTSEGAFNPDVIHSIPYADYCIQQPSPEHFFGTTQLIGTQMRKLIGADISDGAIFKIGNKEYTRREWQQLYQKIVTEQIIQQFKDIDEIFSDPKNIESLLQSELRKNIKYDEQLKTACTLDENGNFLIPLFDPIQSMRIQQLLNSVIRSRVTRLKANGGSLIQATSYGLDDSLKIVWGTRKGKDGKDERYIKYMECLLPAWHKSIIQHCLDENGMLDINKLPNDLRKMIGYRIPTEDKYSMVPIYVKGFTPQQNGSMIILPAEITTIAGSDFDIDKLFFLAYEFTYNTTYDLLKAWNDFYNSEENKDIEDEIDKNLQIAFEDYKRKHPGAEQENIDEYIRDVVQSQGVKKYQFSETAQKRFNNWFSKRKVEYATENTLNKVKYDQSVEPHEQPNGMSAINNMMIDMMWSVLTNPDTASKIMKPGGFNTQKKVARIINILNSCNESQIEALVNQAYIDKERTETNPYKALLNLSLSELTDLAENFVVSKNPLSPTTQVYLQQLNMTGSALIGMYANHNVNHALLQDMGVAINTAIKGTDGGILAYEWMLNGKSLSHISSMYNAEGDRISNNIASFLAASVDNAKEPCLMYLNQSPLTVDATMAFIRSGYTIEEVSMLLNQPIVKDITNTLKRGSDDGKSKSMLLNGVISKYAEKAKGENAKLKEEYLNKTEKFLIEDLMRNIVIGSRDDLYYTKQLKIGYLFKTAMEIGDALSDMVSSMRSDTQKGSAGPNFGHTEVKIQRVSNFLESLTSDDSRIIANGEDFPFTRINYIKDYSDINKVREKLLECSLPYMQAFFSLGVEIPHKMMSKYFPFNSIPVRYAMQTLSSFTKSGRLDQATINSIYNDLIAYTMTNNSFFGGETTLDGRRIDSETKRKKFIYGFPKYFSETIAKPGNEEIAKLGLIKALKIRKADGSIPVTTVFLYNIGSLDQYKKDDYTRDWASLLYIKNADGSRNMDAYNLALNMFLYAYYRNGLAFGPNSFIHLAPIEVRLAIEGYADTMNELMNLDSKAPVVGDFSTPVDYESAMGAFVHQFDNFIGQYVRNHLTNRKLVPEIVGTVPANFVYGEKDVDSKGKSLSGKVKDEFSIRVYDNPTYNDKKFVQKAFSIQDEDGKTHKEFMFFPYIMRNVNGNPVYYVLASKRVARGAVYSRIDPLGGGFLEYDANRPGSMNSAIDQNSRNYEESKTSAERTEGNGESVTAVEKESITIDGFDKSLSDDIQNKTGISLEDKITKLQEEEAIRRLNENGTFYDWTDKANRPGGSELSDYDINEDCITDDEGNNICI